MSGNIIGRGGYAVVYKGCLKDGQFIAVKRLTRGTVEEQTADFLSEMGIIAHVNHPNTAKLVGVGVEGGVNLIFQLSPHGSLGSLLHGSKEKLNWGIRHKVALGTTEGLLYLHENCQRRIIHRDIKADNILLTEDFEAQVYLHGGQVTSWKNELGEELLFVSTKAIFKPPKPIRGGIPICFPQFAGLGPLEAHGFARNRLWSLDTDPPPFPTVSSIKAVVNLILVHSEEDMKIWPHSYEFRLRVALGPGGDLMLTSRIRNTSSDGKPLTFTFAYHTYFSVSDISEVRVEGLETLDYLDNLQNRERFTEQGDAITFESEVDKVYLSTPTKIAIIDHEKKRTFVIRKDGLPDAVVWNPWDKRAKAIPDLGDDDYKHMLCVESAAIEKSITLKPGEEWRGRQELSAVPSSYFSGQLDPQKVLQSS